MIIAVDTGGTKTLLARFSNRGALEDFIKIPTAQTTKEYISEVAKHIHILTLTKTPDTIAIALPDYVNGGVIPAFSNLPWKNFDVLKELQPHFPDTKIVVGNDAKLGALGEATSLRPILKRVIYVTISTGIGAGLVVDGKISHDMLGSEAGHMVLEYDGVFTEWEHFASGKAIFDVYQKFGSEITSKRTWYQIANRISYGFLALIPVLRPDVVIIGGSMGVHFSHYAEQLELLVKEKLPKVIKPPVFMKAKHPEEAVIYGCYYYALEQTTT